MFHVLEIIYCGWMTFISASTRWGSVCLVDSGWVMFFASRVGLSNAKTVSQYLFKSHPPQLCLQQFVQELHNTTQPSLVPHQENVPLFSLINAAAAYVWSGIQHTPLTHPVMMLSWLPMPLSVVRRRSWACQVLKRCSIIILHPKDRWWFRFLWSLFPISRTLAWGSVFLRVVCNHCFNHQMNKVRVTVSLRPQPWRL